MRTPSTQNAVLGGVQNLYFFDNWYGASVVRHEYSYGGESGLWELGVIKHNHKGDFDLTYDTHITDDVLGHLTEDAVDDLLSQIESLK